MAQAGYTPISLYYSTTSTQEPTAGNLVSGELAINIADGKLFYKNSAGNVRLLSIGYGSSSVTPTNGGVQYGTGTALALTAAGSSGQILRSNGAAAPTWADLSTLGVNTISFGTTGLTPNSATAGAVTVAGTLVTANGGTGLGGASPFTANGVLYASSASALTSGSALTFDGTNSFLGIGPGVTPTKSLTIYNPSIDTEIRLQAGTKNFYLAQRNSSGQVDYIVVDNAAQTWSVNNTEQMRLTSTGLGIGTSSPAYKLQVSGTAGLANNGNENLFLLDTAGSNRSSLQISGASNFFNANIDSASHGQYIWRSSNAYTERMRLDSSGNLGIGTSSPTRQLQVSNASNAIISALNGSIEGVLNATTTNVNVGSASNHFLTISINSTERMRLDTSGNLGLGGSAARATTAGSAIFNIFNGTAPVGTLTNGISLYSSSGEAYVMDAAGNATLFSPHDRDTNEWIFRSKHTPSGKVLKIDVERLLRFVNDHFGLDAVQEFIEP